MIFGGHFSNMSSVNKMRSDFDQVYVTCHVPVSQNDDFKQFF